MKKRRSVFWTIGHSNHPIEEFLALLTAQKIEIVADVRHFPGSRRYPQFGQDQLKVKLKQTGIQYVHLLELGGRRRPQPNSRNTAWRNEAFRGYADYMSGPEFRKGIDQLLALGQTKRVAIMCAEVLWWRCHRALISDYLKAAGYTVLHILSATKLQEHPFTSAARLKDGKLTYEAN